MNESNRRTARAAILIIFVVWLATVVAAAVGWLPGWAVAVVTPIAAVADIVLLIRYRRRPVGEPIEADRGWRPPEPEPVYAVPLASGDVTVLVEALEWLDRVTPARYSSGSAGVPWARHLATKVRTNAGLARSLGHETTPLMPFDIHQADRALEDLQRDQPVDLHTVRLGDLVKRLHELKAVAHVRDWTVEMLDKADPGALRIRSMDEIHWSTGKVPPSISDLPAPGPEAQGDPRT